MISSHVRHVNRRRTESRQILAAALSPLGGAR